LLLEAYGRLTAANVFQWPIASLFEAEGCLTVANS
jgi:hypothetical protein